MPSGVGAPIIIRRLSIRLLGDRDDSGQTNRACAAEDSSKKAAHRPCFPTGQPPYNADSTVGSLTEPGSHRVKPAPTMSMALSDIPSKFVLYRLKPSGFTHNT